MSHAASAGACLVASCLLAASCSPPATIRQGAAQREVLTRRVEGLQSLLAAAARGPLVREDQVLVVVHGRLVQDLISATMPLEGDVAGRFRIRVERATVDFDDGLALVRLDGRASVKGEDLFADVSVFGSLEVAELDPLSGVLRGRVKVFAVDVSRLSLEGLDRPARRLVSELSRQSLEAYGALLGAVVIPVRIERQIVIPAAGPGEVEIPAAAIPLDASILDVKAFEGRLWISIGASVGSPGAKGASP